MCKHDMIDAIRQRNPSADPEFLANFGESTLDCYLRRLTQICDRRGSVWVRRCDEPAVVTRTSRRFWRMRAA